MLTKMLRDDTTLPKLAELGLVEALDALYNKTQKLQINLFECLSNSDLLHQAKLNIFNLDGNQRKLAEFSK